MKNKIGSAWIWILIILILIAIGSGIYFWFGGDGGNTVGDESSIPTQPLLSKDNDKEEILRKNIENYYYQFATLEFCEEKSYLGFADKESCQGAMRCASIELSKMIKLEDLNQLVDDMQGGLETEVAVRVYLYYNNIKTEYDLKVQDCLSNNGYDSETYQCRDGACLIL